MNRLFRCVAELDRILRGEATRVADLRDATIEIPLRGITFIVVLLGILYGVCMGCYALVNQANYMQMIASAVKVPALFLLTLIVTLPSLYVFNALVGSRLALGSLVRLFIATLAVNLAVLASLGPIVAFFSVNTTTYSFVVLLNIIVFTVSGILGLGFLLQTLHRLHIARYFARYDQQSRADRTTPPGETPDASEASAGASAEQPSIQAEPIDRPAEAGSLEATDSLALGLRIRTVFTIWMIVFGLVGAQMSWILRPFIGSPDMPFRWLRPRDGNFFEAAFKVLRSVFGS